MTLARFVRLLSSLLVMNLSIISGQRAECPMGKASDHASAHSQATAHHSGHEANAGHDASAVSDSPESCDMGCPPAACASGSHCSTVAFRSDSQREALPLSHSTLLLALSTSTDRLVHPPDPPPPRG
ncbi:MAG TPA: hypothetical protein VFT21_05040 [Gemmatimonadaceae bacterium]|nr:hypothetical protein [Gemmatimonadaceae bacterium]